MGMEKYSPGSFVDIAQEINGTANIVQNLYCTKCTRNTKNIILAKYVPKF
jgi:hypothetical protein